MGRNIRLVISICFYIMILGMSFDLLNPNETLVVLYLSFSTVLSYHSIKNTSVEEFNKLNDNRTLLSNVLKYLIIFVIVLMLFGQIVFGWYILLYYIILFSMVYILSPELYKDL